MQPSLNTRRANYVYSRNLSVEKIDELRKEMYNATVVGVVECRDNLRVIRIGPDWGAVRFQPGRCRVLSLGSWEPRIDLAAHDDLGVAQQSKLLKRVYSFSGPMLDPTCTQKFQCGNPAMIGAPRLGMSGSDKYPKPLGLVEVLESMGFQVDQRGEKGNIRFEKYW